MDRIKIFGNRLKKVQDGLTTMRYFGLDEEILICWLKQHLKINDKMARSILKCEEDFFNRLLKQDILDKLESGGK